MDRVQKAIQDMRGCTRIGDRKAGAQLLEDTLESDDFLIHRLNCNSVVPDRKGDKMTWTVLFLEVRDYFIKETDRGALTLPNKLFYAGLVRRIFEKATRNGPLLNWNKVFDFIVNHLQKDRHAQIFGVELMDLLQSFLEIDLYRSFLDSSAWIELITTLFTCKKKQTISTSSLLSCLKLCIVQGSLFDLVIPYIRSNVVKFYSTVIQDDFNEVQRYVLSYLQGLIELCNQNAVEFRGILCQLGETVIPYILQMQSFNEEEDAALVEFLLVQYSLHMPDDCDVKSYAFYASDPAKWKEILRLIYTHCIDIIEDKSHRKTIQIDEKLSERFLLLAAKCTKQISSPLLAENESSDDEGAGMLAKKKMRYKSFNTIISDIHRKPVQEGLTIWMNYVKTVLTHFPELIENKLNLSNLLYLGSRLFNTRLMVRREFFDYFSSLLEAETFLRKHKSLGDAADTWCTVWDLTIKSISICEGKEEAINLLRRILKNIRPPNITPLLLLYVNNYMPLTKCSVQLLAEYLALTTLPVQINDSNLVSQNLLLVDEEIAVTTCPRQALIRWLINVSNSDIAGFEPLVAALLCSLIVKQTGTLIKLEVELYPESKVLRNSFEMMLLRSSFVKEPNEKEQITKKLNKLPVCKFIVLQRPAERLADAMQMDYEKIPGLNNTEIAANGKAPVRLDCKLFTNKINLYLNVLNVIEKHSVGESASTGQVGFRTVLERVFDTGIEKCNQITLARLLDKDALGRSPEAVKNVIGLSRRLFSNRNLCDKMRTSLNQKFSLQVVETIRRVFRSNLANYIRGALNNIQEGDVTFFADDLASNMRMLGMFEKPEELYLMTKRDLRVESMSLEALKFLIDYGVVCERKVEHFTELIKDLQAERFSSANLYLFDACFMLISEISQIQDSASVQELINLINELLQRMCRGYHLVPHCVEKLWSVFEGLTPHFATYQETSRLHFMILVGTAFNFLKANAKVPKNVHRKALTALAELAKSDPDLSWSQFAPVTNNVPTVVWILEELTLFLDNNSHEVRQLAVDAICTMYEFARPFDYSKGILNSQEELAGFTAEGYQERRKQFLDVVFQALLNSFDVEHNISSDEVAEESVNRTSLTLSCLTRLIFAYPYAQKQNIMFLFLIVKLKNIDVRLAKRALDYISPNATKTMCCYFSYVLKKMLKLTNTLEDLPYQFFGCENNNSFLMKFQNEICVEYFEQDRKPELEAFATGCNISAKNLIKQCYGLIMARLTPGLAIHTYQLNPRGLNLEKNNELHKRLIVQLGGKDATDTLMATCVGDVLLNLISLTFEPGVSNTWACSEIKLAEPVPPHYPEDTIETCLEFLKDASPHNNITLVGYLAKTSHQSIYKIMLSLAVRIHDAHDQLEKYWRLHQFNFFIGLLFNEPSEIFLSMKEYVCNFTLNTYLRLLKTEAARGRDEKIEDESVERFLKVVFFLLTKLVIRITEQYTDEMQVFFNPVIRGIVSATVQYPALAPCTKNVLDFLLKNRGHMFADGIINLDPFPSDIPWFEEYNQIHLDKKYGSRRAEWPLSKEFERILEGADNVTNERLKFLGELLTQRKRDLDRMVRSIEAKRFSDECEKDPIHNIIQMLIGVTLSSTRDEELAIEACKCLGEIGPVDLSVLVLPPYKSQGKINLAEDALLTIIEIVSSYLSSDDIRLVTVASKVLRDLLEFTECAGVVNVGVGNARLFKVLRPFRCTQKELIKTSVEKVDANLLETKLGLNEMNEGIDYRSWLTQLIIGIIECFKRDSSLVSIFLPLCQIRLDFCEDVFPYVVYLCLHGGQTNPLVKRVMTGYFRNFFTKFISNLNSISESSRSFTPSSSGTASSIIYMNKLALRSLIRVTQFLRRHSPPQENKGSVKRTPWDSNFWIEINYLDVARAAQYCGAYLTSILYIEIAATEMDMNRHPSPYSDEYNDDDSQDQTFFSQGASMYPQNRTEASKMEKLLLKAYSSIGEVDAAFGCGSARFADPQSTMQHVGQQKEWARLLTLANGSSIDRESCSDAHVVQSLKQLGTCNILWNYLKGVELQNGSIPEDLKQAQFECGWRLSNWDLNADKPAYIKDVLAEDSSPQSAFQMCLYESIQTGITKDEQNHLAALRNGYRSVHAELRHASLESSENLYGFMSHLQLLRVVEDFVGKENISEYEINASLSKWKVQDRIPVSDFQYQEPSLYLRNVLLRAFDANNPKISLENEIVDSLVDLTSKAREASHLYYAESCATSLSSVCTKPSISKELEIAKNKWVGQKTQDALAILNRLIKKSTHEDELYPTLLLVYGDWLAESHCERPTVILEKYLQRACNIYEKRTPGPEVSKAYIVLAKYADAQYQNVTKYISSDVFLAKMDHSKRAKSEALLTRNSTHEESRRSAIVIHKHSCNDDEEIRYIFQDQKKFLKLALRHYLKGLKTSNEHDLLIFRAISLWLENVSDREDELIEETTRIFNDESMPSYKYIVVLHQLSARLNNKGSLANINRALRDILCKCAEEHPYHTLPILLTQASLHKDESIPITKNSSIKIQLADRVQAAADIVASLKKQAKQTKLVTRMEALWLALIKLANISDGSRNQDGVKKTISPEIMKQFANLETIPVPTSNIPVLPSQNYKDSTVGISGFGKEYGLVGGINSPKKISCRGTNGVSYNMLLKGQDDLRQDAVMQQVFGVMNKLLQVEPMIKARRLQIRTYKVIPLSQRTGLIEWVENTQTLGEYLVGGEVPGAHVRYRPNDYKPIDCRRLMMDAKNSADPERRYATYMSICEHFKPVFRHFFFESFKEAGVFFEKRLAYTRSVATNSIVGYILGLGDRHVLNILIDKNTAEFIHIDLGVAFEQGRILPTPETIPFRLTRDIIDGMGISGPEGVFRKSCEMTMKVLRRNVEIIITVLQVLLYDPLYMWALTTDRVARVQPSDSAKGRKSKSNVEPAEESAKERNNSASRVLLRLRQKLMGIEEEGGQTGAISSGSAISIEGHVSLLIQRAQDPEKLSKLFAGWQPYL